MYVFLLDAYVLFRWFNFTATIIFSDDLLDEDDDYFDKREDPVMRFYPYNPHPEKYEAWLLN